MHIYTHIHIKRLIGMNLYQNKAIQEFRKARIKEKIYLFLFPRNEAKKNTPAIIKKKLLLEKKNIS